MLSEIFPGVSKTNLRHVFLYAFGSINKYALRAAISDKDLTKELWAIASSNGYVLKNCKLYAYATAVGRASPKDYGVIQSDASFLRSVYQGKTDWKSYTLKEFDELETRIITSSHLKSHIGKFISRKLIFLVRSYGLTRDELHSHFICVALTVLRKQYPRFLSELHALNACKTGIHNAGMGLIEYYTRDKRNALRQENGGFQAVNVNIDVMKNVGVPPEHDSEFRTAIQNLVAIHAKMENQIEAAFLNAAAGCFDAGVSLFIGLNNSDAADVWTYQRYLTALRKYYGVTEEAQAKLLENLRKLI